MKYYIFIIIGIILYLYLNGIERFLIDFNINRMNRCKNETCSLISGDCKQQCMRTLFYTDDTIYERTISEDANTVITEYLSQIGNSASQDFNPPSKPLEEYEWLKNSDDLALKLIDIFSDIPINKARLILFFIGDDRILHHFIIFSRSETNIYMLDPKNKIINKNSDILYHPWFNQQIGFDTYDWSISNYHLNYGLYFWPIYNVDRSDVNPNKDADNEIIRALLTNRDNPNLDETENNAYSEWKRRIPTGEIVSGGCTDLPNEMGNEWKEPVSPHNNCRAYERNPDWCDLRHDARVHCCVCGGGARGGARGPPSTGEVVGGGLPSPPSPPSTGEVVGGYLPAPPSSFCSVSLNNDDDML